MTQIYDDRAQLQPHHRGVQHRRIVSQPERSERPVGVANGDGAGYPGADTAMDKPAGVRGHRQLQDLSIMQSSAIT